MSPLSTLLVLLPLPLFSSLMPDGPGASTAVDVVTLRDGKTIAGELRESTARTAVLFVRRDWAREQVPDWLKRWEAAEKVSVPRAVQQRRERLTSWRRDRTIPP